MSEKRQRKNRLTIRFNDPEWEALQTRSDIAGLSMAGYGRSSMLSAPPLPQSRRPPVVIRDLARLLAHIGKIGSNINQLAKIANMGGWPEHDDIMQAVADIRIMRDAVLKALNVGPREPDEKP